MKWNYWVCYNNCAMFCSRYWWKFHVFVRICDACVKLCTECYKLCRSINGRFHRQKVLCKKPTRDKLHTPPSPYPAFIGVNTLARVACLVFSVLGMAVSGYFYSVCLLYMFVNNKTLGRVLDALRLGGKSKIIIVISCIPCTYIASYIDTLNPSTAWQLISVAIFGVVIFYIYAVISFAFFREFFNSRNGIFCETLFQCYMTVLRVGLLSSYGNVRIID